LLRQPRMLVILCALGIVMARASAPVDRPPVWEPPTAPSLGSRGAPPPRATVPSIGSPGAPPPPVTVPSIGQRGPAQPLTVPSLGISSEGQQPPVVPSQR